MKQRVAPSQSSDLSGARILLVEDEYYIADDLRRTPESAGATIVGPISTVERAFEVIAKGDFDCAVVDLNLHGDSGFPLVERLMRDGHSFAIATGYGSAAVPPVFKDVPRIEKPFDPPALINLVSQLRCTTTSRKPTLFRVEGSSNDTG